MIPRFWSGSMMTDAFCRIKSDEAITLERPSKLFLTSLMPSKNGSNESLSSQWMTQEKSRMSASVCSQINHGAKWKYILTSCPSRVGTFAYHIASQEDISWL